MSYIQELVERAVGGEFSVRMSSQIRRDSARDIESTQKACSRKRPCATGAHGDFELSIEQFVAMIGSGSSSHAVVDYAGASDRRWIGQFMVCGFRKLQSSDLAWSKVSKIQ